MAEQTFWNVQTDTGKSCFGGERGEGGRCGRRRIAAAAAVGKDATGAQGHVPALSVCVCVHGPRPRPIATWDNRPSVCVYVCIVCRGVFLSVLGLISFFSCALDMLSASVRFPPFPMPCLIYFALLPFLLFLHPFPPPSLAAAECISRVASWYLYLLFGSFPLVIPTRSILSFWRGNQGTSDMTAARGE